MTQLLTLRKPLLLAVLAGFAVFPFALSFFISFLATKVALGGVGADAIVFSVMYVAIPNLLFFEPTASWTALTAAFAVLFWLLCAVSLWVLFGGRASVNREAL